MSKRLMRHDGLRPEVRRRVLLVVLLGMVFGVLTAGFDGMRIIRGTWAAAELTPIALGAAAAWLLAAFVLPRRRVPRAWRHMTRGLGLLVAAVGVAGLMQAVVRWGTRLDSPVVLYPARLAFSEGRVPYRDIFDFNLPGSYVVYGLLDRFTPTDMGLRIVDGVLVLLSGVASMRAFRLASRPAAGLAVGLFAISHLQDTGVDCLQREVFVVALTLTAGACWETRRPVLAALAFTLAFWMKFHAVFLIAPFVWEAVRTWTPNTRTRAAQFALVFTGGCVLVLAGMAAVGALGPWIELARGYLPLYGRMAGTLTFTRTADLMWQRRLYTFFDPTAHPPIVGLLLVAALLLGQRASATHIPDTTRRAVGFYLGSLGYTLLQGTFWPYHSIPAYFAIGVMCAVLLSRPRNALEGLAALSLVGVVAFHAYGPRVVRSIDWEGDGRNASAQRMAEQLVRELPHGETVQPLDIVEGVVDAMRRAHAPLATSFVYDFHFYHHVHDPFVVRLRARFLRELRESRPYFVIASLPGRRVRPYGEDTENDWPELDGYLRENYEIHRDEDGFRWWRRRE